MAKSSNSGGGNKGGNKGGNSGGNKPISKPSPKLGDIRKAVNEGRILPSQKTPKEKGS